MNAEDVVARAREWLGAPFHHQGRVRCGTDCVGLLAHAFGVDPGPADYGEQPEPRMMRAGLDRFCVRAEGDLMVADVLLLRIKHDPQHVALVSRVDPPMMIHALRMRKGGRVVEHSIDRRWWDLVVARYRFRWPRS